MLDKTNIAIAKQLQDGRKSLGRIAEELDVAENTVRSRLARMEEDGQVHVTSLVDPTAMEGAQLTMVGVKLSSMNLVDKGKEFSELRGVINVAVVTGRYDLIVTALLTPEFGLLEFYQQEVEKISGVQSVETFVIYKSYNMEVPGRVLPASAAVESTTT